MSAVFYCVSHTTIFTRGRQASPDSLILAGGNINRMGDQTNSKPRVKGEFDHVHDSLDSSDFTSTTKQQRLCEKRKYNVPVYAKAR
jgi:hypothetical protein